MPGRPYFPPQKSAWKRRSSLTPEERLMVKFVRTLLGSRKFSAKLAKETRTKDFGPVLKVGTEDEWLDYCEKLAVRDNWPFVQAVYGEEQVAGAIYGPKQQEEEEPQEEPPPATMAVKHKKTKKNMGGAVTQPRRTPPLRRPSSSAPQKQPAGKRPLLS